MIGIQTAAAGAFDMLGRVVDEQGFGRIQLLLMYDSPEAFLLGFADMQDMGEIGGFEDGLEKVKTILLLQMGRETVVIELVGVAEQIKIVLFFLFQQEVNSGSGHVNQDGIPGIPHAPFQSLRLPAGVRSPDEPFLPLDRRVCPGTGAL